MKERYRHMMEQVELSDSARASMEEKLEAGAPAAPRKKHRPLRAALIAACVCLALVGTAAASGVIPGVPTVVFKQETLRYNGQPGTSFTTVLDTGEEEEETEEAEEGSDRSTSRRNPLGESEVRGVLKMPIAVFSDELQALAAESEGQGSVITEMNFAKWEDYEEFLGFELMDNPLLEKSWIMVSYHSASQEDLHDPGNSYTCYVHCLAVDGELRGIRGEIGYSLMESSVYVHAAVYTKQSPIDPKEVFGGYGFPEGYTFTTETYTSPNGLVAALIGVSNAKGEQYCSYAQFAMNGAAFTLECCCNYDMDYSFKVLKTVIDAFEF